MGLEPFKSPLQTKEVSISLRNLLWTTLCDAYFDHADEWGSYGVGGERGQAVRNLITSIWRYHFKFASDEFFDFKDAIGVFRKYFFECQWNKVYELVEYVAQSENEEIFTTICNSWLEQENAAYRFVENTIVPITSRAEIDEIEAAAKSGIHGVKVHISTALSCLADRKNPDYRNCVKESISAVETICRSFTGGSTLSNALKALKKKVEIHPAFESALQALYGYTSDESGVRHSLLEESTITFSDAKFMLVTCSAFANYLIGKAAESGIKLKA